MNAEDALGVYLEAMLAENQQLSLTGIRDPQEAHVLHVLDSLQIGELGLAPRRCLDLGTGNGFPGIALCALFPEAAVCWMERTGKKLAAMQRILATPAVSATKQIARCVRSCRSRTARRSPLCPKACSAGNTALVAATAISAMGNCCTRFA